MAHIDKKVGISNISRRLTYYIVLCSSLVTLLLTGFELYRDYQWDISQIELKFEEIENVHVNSLAASLWSVDIEKVDIILEGLSRLRDISYVALIGEGEIFIDIGKSTPVGSMSKIFPLSVEVNGAPRNIGELTVSVDLGQIYARLKAKATLVLTTNAIKTALVVMFMLLVFDRVVIRHLKTITRYISNFEAVHLIEPLALNRRERNIAQQDELDSVVDALNEATIRNAAAFNRVQVSEIALRESESRYKEASNLANLGHWSYDKVRDRLVHCSDELARIHGVSPDTYVEMISSTEKDIERVHPEDRETYAKIIRGAQRDATPFYVEYRIIRPDGEVRHVREIGEPVLDDTGKMVQERGTIQDITSRKKLEDQLRQSQRMEAVGQLTGGVAHDFNNLLAIMLGNTEFLEDLAGDDKEAKNNIEAIKAAVARASSLTGRLLAFSRQSTLAPVAADVGKLISGLNDMLQRALGETVELKIEDTEDLWPAMIDTHQFENALVNLALNARDAMPQGGILTIETANVALDETYAEQYEEVTPGDYVKVAVSDTGTGIPSDVLEKVFEPFFTTKEVGKGTGLGLSMVFGFVKQSNGHITIYSEVGHGTSFKLYIPRSQDEPVEIDVKFDVLEHAQGSERILVVEDDADVRIISVAILGDQGYEVVEAGNGEDAISQLKAGQPFDLLFTDVVLPGGMNGAEIAKEARRIQPGIKVLYTTGYAENAVIHHGKLVRGMNMVNKPYRRTELLEKVREALSEKVSGILIPPS